MDGTYHVFKRDRRAYYSYQSGYIYWRTLGEGAKEASAPPSLVKSLYKSFMIKGKVQTMIFLKMVLIHFA